jgi:hypothetical protein
MIPKTKATTQNPIAQTILKPLVSSSRPSPTVRKPSAYRNMRFPNMKNIKLRKMEINEFPFDATK